MSVVTRVAVVVGCLVLGAVAALAATAAYPQLASFGAEPETSNTEVVNAVNRVEEVALVSLGIQGITESRSNSEILGVAIPGSDRAVFLQYNFTAKLGINGEDVKVTQTGENSFRVTIPAFIFIGHDDIVFKSAAENNGVLSWVTADIDKVDLVNDVLDEGGKNQYLAANSDLLEDQAQGFYESIIHGIDPEIDVEFEFAA